MPFTMLVMPKAREAIDDLETTDPVKCRKVVKATGGMRCNQP